MHTPSGGLPTILISELPAGPWWPEGIPAYDDNWVMQAHYFPDQARLREQHAMLVSTIRQFLPVQTVPFPPTLDRPGGYYHDFVYVRDHFVSNPGGPPILGSFGQIARRPETAGMRHFLDGEKIAYTALETGEHAEGGDFIFLPHERVLIAGIRRNNRAGIRRVAQRLGTDYVLIVHSPAYHLDTVLSVLRDGNDHAQAALACLGLIENADEVRTFLHGFNIDVIEADVADSAGTPQHPGNLSINGLSLPGIFINGSRIRTPGVEQEIERMGIERVTVLIPELQRAGGSVRCLTNELYLYADTVG